MDEFESGWQSAGWMDEMPGASEPAVKIWLRRSGRPGEILIDAHSEHCDHSAR